ncbi:biosynthetic-type acetolactate synthase large subunit [Pelagibaculum spongiae]|uniref:Acetolactate synthase n=1 Tax=Pelagibaculum spongiae TaxID=2080658 RepID=A0A2V1GWM9_9GAMM|nr:biosynthetic-type acetolactate synthase large subunit [Pelagibaculum spongiae]PVZ69734.1 biosynthetic-type acetolactate synthase large subunit [Pelagibaculum spongiae]
MKMTGAHAICESLISEGVEIIFGYPGGAIMPTYDALYDVRDRLKHVLVRHEQGAGHAAQGYARATGKVGVALATSGPGSTNLVTAMMDATMDSTPIVCITGQVASHLLGTDAFQESDIMGMSIPATKWCTQVSDPAEIPAVLAKAFHIAQDGRPGPVLVDITKDAQISEMDFSYQHHIETIDTSKLYPHKYQDLSQLELAAELLNNAKKPFMLLGHGVLISQAEKQAVELADKSGIPTACTLLGLSAMAPDHELYVGMPGMHGNYGANLLTNEADVIIAIGMRFDDRITGRLDQYGSKAKFIHIDIDPSEMNKNVLNTASIVADAGVALDALLPLVNEQKHPEWIAEYRRCDEIEYKKVIKNDIFPTKGPLHMGEAVRKISDLTSGDAIVVSDVGQHQMVTARYYNYRNPNSHITSGGLGTMGFSLPAAIGAQMGRLDKQVIAIMGDGGFQMNLQEMATLHQEGAPLKVVILNNSHLGMVRQWQEMFFDERYSFVGMENPDFVALSKGFYVDAERVEDREDLEGAIQRMLDAPGPRLLEVVVQNMHNVFPMVATGDSVSQVRLD